jgi:hypothetical protein
MRISGLASLAVAVAACGGAPKAGPSAERPRPSYEARVCNEYSLRLSPFLARFDAALESYQARRRAAYDDAGRGEAAAELGDFLAGEVNLLRLIRVPDRELYLAHLHMIAALEEVGRGHEQLATGFALQDREVRKRARNRLVVGWGGWSDASRFIVAHCRETARYRAQAQGRPQPRR